MDPTSRERSRSSTPPFRWDPIPPRNLRFSQPIKSLMLWKIYD